MKKIKIHFTRNKRGKIFSKILQWYESIPVSHVTIEMENIISDCYFHSVIGAGVSIMSERVFLDKNEIMETYEIYLNDYDYAMLKRYIIKNLGEPYSILQNLGIALHDFLMKFYIKIANPWKKGYNCSELVFLAIINKIYEGYEHIEPDIVTPKDIRDILLENEEIPVFSKIVKKIDK